MRADTTVHRNTLSLTFADWVLQTTDIISTSPPSGTMTQVRTCLMMMMMMMIMMMTCQGSTCVRSPARRGRCWSRATGSRWSHVTCYLRCNVLVTRLLSRPPLLLTRAGSLGGWGRAWCSDATPTAAPPQASTGTRVSGASPERWWYDTNQRIF